MSVRRETPLGIKVIVALGAIDGGLHVVGGLLRLFAGLLGNPIAVLTGLLAVGIGLGQLGVLYGLYTMQEWGWTWTVRILAAMAILDVLALLLGQATPLGLVLTLVILAYVYSQKSKYVRRSYA